MNNEALVTKDNKKQYPLIDLIKFIASFFVIMIHIDPFYFTVDGKETLLSSILTTTFSGRGLSRLAVPFFFVCTGFFLFKKIKTDKDGGFKYVTAYIKRIIILYFSWLVFNLPVIIQNRFLNNKYTFLENVFVFFRELFVGNIYNVSWFLLACIYGVLIVYVLSKLKNKYIYLIITSLFFIIQLLMSNYAIVLNGKLVEIKENYRIYGVWYSTLLSSALFVAIGKIISDNENIISKKTATVGFIITFTAYMAECYLIRFAMPKVSGATPDAYITLPFVIYFGFILVIKTGIKAKPVYSDMRSMSTVIYLSHYEILAYSYLINWKGQYWLQFLAVAVLSTAIAFVIVTLSKKYKCFKYLY